MSRSDRRSRLKIFYFFDDIKSFDIVLKHMYCQHSIVSHYVKFVYLVNFIREYIMLVTTLRLGNCLLFILLFKIARNDYKKDLFCFSFSEIYYYVSIRLAKWLFYIFSNMYLQCCQILNKKKYEQKFSSLHLCNNIYLTKGCTVIYPYVIYKSSII